MIKSVSGIAFPFRFSNLGGVARNSGLPKICSNLQALVSTAVKERLVRKNVGTVGYRKVHRNAGEIGDEILEALVLEAITEFEPRITVTKLLVFSIEDQGKTKLIARVTYTQRNSVVSETADIPLE